MTSWLFDIAIIFGFVPVGSWATIKVWESVTSTGSEVFRDVENPALRSRQRRPGTYVGVRRTAPPIAARRTPSLFQPNK